MGSTAMARLSLGAAFVLLFSLTTPYALELRTDVSVNPIRKVVTLLQMGQKKVTAEGEKEKDLYDKFMCYCKNGAGDLSGSISAAETKIPQVGSDIDAAQSDKAKTEEELKGAQADLAAAKAAMK